MHSADKKERSTLLKRIEDLILRSNRRKTKNPIKSKLIIIPNAIVPISGATMVRYMAIIDNNNVRAITKYFLAIFTLTQLSITS